jgi:hypothetical protein
MTELLQDLGGSARAVARQGVVVTVVLTLVPTDRRQLGPSGRRYAYGSRPEGSCGARILRVLRSSGPGGRAR